MAAATLMIPARLQGSGNRAKPVDPGLEHHEGLLVAAARGDRGLSVIDNTETPP